MQVTTRSDNPIPAEGTPMTLRSKPATELAGRAVQDPGNLLLGSMARIPTAQEKQVAADQMRYQLYVLDRSAQRMSIEDCCAALLERAGNESGSELPS
jgi:hypothetical protein